VDVRIRRADLPEQNSQAVYQRMQTERQREAAEFRAQGSQKSQEIRARADRDVTVLVAETQTKADTIRGEGDAERNRIFAEAYGKDPDFFAFYRSMQPTRRDCATTTPVWCSSPIPTSSAISPTPPANCVKTPRNRVSSANEASSRRPAANAIPGCSMTDFIVAIGLVFVIEGLIFAASPAAASAPWRMFWRPPTGRCA